jgi:hypothetical protein
VDFKKFEPIDWFLVITVLSLVSVYLLFGIPSMIYDTFKYNGAIDLFSASDILQFYGILLGASATIVAVRWTIKTTNKSAEQDRKNTIVTNHRNIGIKTCQDLIEMCDFVKVINIINNENSKCEKNDLVFVEGNEDATIYNNFTILNNEIKIAHINWQFVYPLIEEITKDFFDNYVIGYQKELESLQNTIKYNKNNNNRFSVCEDNYAQVIRYQETHQPDFIHLIRKLAHEYDCETAWGYKFNEDKNVKIMYEKERNLSKDNHNQ